MTPARSTWRARLESAAPLLLALAAHTAVVVTVASIALPTTSSAMASSNVEPEPTAGTEIDVGIEPTADRADDGARVAALAPAGAAANDPATPQVRPELVAAAETNPTNDFATGAHTTEAGAHANEGADAGAGTADWFHPTTSFDLRLHERAGSAAGAREAPRAQNEAPRPVSTSGGLHEALDAADVAKGLGRGGPVRSAIDLAARGADAPTFGNATFSVVLGSDGSVSVALADASSERAGWDRLRPSIQTALLNAKARIPPRGKGVRVTVHVDASEQFPGGGRPTPPEKQGAAVHGSIGSVTETKEHVEFEPPSVTLSYRTRGCGAGVVINPGGLSLGGGCEPGVAMRVVATKIVSEERL